MAQSGHVEGAQALLDDVFPHIESVIDQTDVDAGIGNASRQSGTSGSILHQNPMFPPLPASAHLSNSTRSAPQAASGIETDSSIMAHDVLHLIAIGAMQETLGKHLQLLTNVEVQLGWLF